MTCHRPAGPPPELGIGDAIVMLAAALLCLFAPPCQREHKEKPARAVRPSTPETTK